jgi:D-alanyl-D-alanine dipeptidase
MSNLSMTLLPLFSIPLRGAINLNILARMNLLARVLSMSLVITGCMSDHPTMVTEASRAIPHIHVERLSPLDSLMTSLGLVDVHSKAPQVLVDLRYSSTNNFVGTDLYGRMRRCYVQPVVAGMIARVQEYLNTTHPGRRLMILDGARPVSVQRVMWDSVRSVPGPKYVAAPVYGSLHNYGAAVDVTLADSTGNELDMGTPFDAFDSLAQPRFEMYFYEQGRLTQEQLDNRWTLRTAMKQAGFYGILKEWWHFNAMTLEEASARYKIIE